MFCGYMLPLILYFLFPFFSFFFFRFFSLPMYLGCWRAYVVPVVSNTLAWHCVVYFLYSITMQYLCIVRSLMTTELVPF